MLYHIESVIRRLQDAEKGLVTEEELVRLATPKINQSVQILELLQKAVRAGYTESYTIGDAAKHSGIPRQTFYRWIREGIIQPDKTGKIKISEMLQVLKMIEKRHSGKG